MDKNRLVIKGFLVEEVKFGDKVLYTDNTLYIKEKRSYEFLFDFEKLNKYIKDFNISIIKPGCHNVFVNSVMDFIPISTKVLGEIGYGITHNFQGVTVMVTGVDNSGNQIGEFGDSSGILSNVVKFGTPATPNMDEYLIHIDFLVNDLAHKDRECINSIFYLCDHIINDIRGVLKKVPGTRAHSRGEFLEKSTNGKKILLIKQVAGQGAMYDTRVYGFEPGGYMGGYSVIDFRNLPILISKNQYRDGILKAMH